jgi:hypothetical protein
VLYAFTNNDPGLRDHVEQAVSQAVRYALDYEPVALLDRARSRLRGSSLDGLGALPSGGRGRHDLAKARP